MTTITTKISRELAVKLEAAARAQRVSKSDIVRQSLEEHLKGKGRKRRPTFGELAGDLIGCLEGPGDLSHNPKYMEGYGE